MYADMKEKDKGTTRFRCGWLTLSARAPCSVFEAGFFPGAVYLLSTWYTRFDMQKRYVAFYTIGCVAGSLGGILAFGLGKMDGLAGLRGWRWIFIVEGVISCLVGILSYVFLVDFPEEADRSWRFLSTSERDFIVRRVNRDRADAVTEPFSWTAYLEAATDVKVWVFAFMFFCVTTVGYSINYFLPIILVGMGQSPSPPLFSFARLILELRSGSLFLLTGFFSPLVCSICSRARLF